MLPEGGVSGVVARTVGSRIHIWLTDTYGDDQGIGYFLFDPHEASNEVQEAS